MKHAVRINGLLFGSKLTQGLSRVLVPAFACFQIGEQVKIAGKTSWEDCDGVDPSTSTIEVDGAMHVVTEDDMLIYGCIVENYDYTGYLVSRFTYGEGCDIIVLDSEYNRVVCTADVRKQGTESFKKAVVEAHRAEKAKMNARINMDAQRENERKAIENLSKSVEMPEADQKSVIKFLSKNKGKGFSCKNIQSGAGLSISASKTEKGLVAMFERGQIDLIDYGKYGIK